jgi:hypothetical protein
MTLEKRVTELERRVGQEDDFSLFVIAAIGCDPDKLGPERALYRKVTGYEAAGTNRAWPLQPGETADQLKERIEQELRAEGRRAFAVCECYDD